MFEDINICPLCEGERKEEWCGDSYKCSDCQLVYVRNRIAENKLVKFYRGYNQDREEDTELENKRKIMYQNDYNYIVKHTKSISRDSPVYILDVGCGNGEFLELFNNFAPRTHKVGIEIDQNSRIYRNKDSNTNIQEVYRDFDDLNDYSSLKHYKFDIIIFRGTLQYMRDLKRTREFIDNYLSDNGKLFILALPNSESVCYQLFRHKWVLHNPIEHINTFSLSTVSKLFNYLEIENFKYPYLKTPYASVRNNTDSLVNLFYNIEETNVNKYKFAYWDNMLNISLKRK